MSVPTTKESTCPPSRWKTWSSGTATTSSTMSFPVGDGEIFAIIGPNGAGKTTIVESIEGLRRPDAGVSGCSGSTRCGTAPSCRQRVGAQLQESQFPDRIKVWEALDCAASFYRRRCRWPELLDQLGLTPSATPGSAGSPVVSGSACRSRSRWSANPQWRARRAHHRARPAGSARHLGPGRDPSTRGHHRARHPFHGGGGTPRRPGGADRRGRLVAIDTPAGLVARVAGAAAPVPALGTHRGCVLRGPPGVTGVDRAASRSS